MYDLFYNSISFHVLIFSLLYVFLYICILIFKHKFYFYGKNLTIFFLKKIW